MDVTPIIARLNETAEYRRAVWAREGKWFRDVSGDSVVRVRVERYVQVR